MMNGSKGEDLLLEYLRGSPSPERAEELRLALKKLGLGARELEELRAVYCGIDAVVDAAPSDSMTTSFYSMLAAEKRKAAKSRHSVWALAERLRSAARLRPATAARIIPRLAYAALLIVAGWTAGSWLAPGRGADREIEYLTSEMAHMKKLVMFSMLNRESATERLQAVYYLGEIAREDDQALAALVMTLDGDANVNIRLAALDALSGLAAEPRIRDRLLATIDRQEAPLVLLQLVDIMVSLDERRAVGPFKQLLERRDLSVIVRDHVSDGLRNLL